MRSIQLQQQRSVRKNRVFQAHHVAGLLEQLFLLAD